MIKQVLISMRPKQWIKNILIFAPLIFSQNVTDPAMLGRAIAAFLLFCLLTGGVYLFNDLIDLDQDKLHPQKRNRPLASGKLRPAVCLGLGPLLAILALGISLVLDRRFALIALGYFFLQLAYMLYLKHVVIIDCFAIALGFVLRVIAGAVVIEVPISSWLVICIILLSLFLAFGKRRYELTAFSEEAKTYRRVLAHYNIYLLDSMISVVTSATLLAYILYTMSEETVRKFNTTNLKYTVPFVLYGICRYLYLIHKRQKGGAPERTLLSDPPLLVNILLYGVVVGIILYY